MRHSTKIRSVPAANNYQDAVNICEYLTDEYDTFVQIAPDYSFGYGGAQAFRDACTLFGARLLLTTFSHRPIQPSLHLYGAGA